MIILTWKFSNYVHVPKIGMGVEGIHSWWWRWWMLLGVITIWFWSRKWHSSILAWKIPWTEEASGLQSVGLQRVEHDLKWLNRHPCILCLNLVFVQVTKEIDTTRICSRYSRCAGIINSLVEWHFTPRPAWLHAENHWKLAGISMEPQRRGVFGDGRA